MSFKKRYSFHSFSYNNLQDVCVCVYVCVCAYSVNCVWLFVVQWTVSCQASLSMGFSRQEYWHGLPFPPPIIGYYLKCVNMNTVFLCSQGHKLTISSILYSVSHFSLEIGNFSLEINTDYFNCQFEKIYYYSLLSMK